MSGSFGHDETGTGEVPSTPLIYISYGMPKSGSTLAFELTKVILELNGFKQKRLSRAAIPTDEPVNAADALNAANLEAIEREAAALGYPIVVKTHHALTPDVRAWIAEGRIHGHCVYRDLREIALSMMDHGARARARGRKAFSAIGSIEDALRNIRRQVPVFQDWARQPGFVPLYYDDVAFETQATVRRLCAQMKLEADPARVERRVKRWRFTQYNKGVRGRFHEMAPQDGERILREFQAYYEAFIHPHGPPPPPPEPERGLWGKLLRRILPQG
jgi:hypothetical protein